MRSPSRPVVAISSSLDPLPGTHAVPLDRRADSETVDAVLRRALDLDDSPSSLRRLVANGESVVIKPNIVTSRSHRASSYWHGGRPHSGQITDLRVIRSLVHYLMRRCRPGRITIAEGPAEWGSNGSRRALKDQTCDGWTVRWPEFDDLSYESIAEEANREQPGLVDLVDLNEDDLVEVPVGDPAGSGIGPLFRLGQLERDVDRFGRGAVVPNTGTPVDRHLAARTLLRADRLVSVAAMKTHTGTGVTLAMKNYVGIRPTRKDLGIDKGDVHRGWVDAAIVDLFCLRPADYAIVEGFHATEGNGPQWGEDIHHNVVVASADTVAADAVAATVMGFVPTDVEHLVLAAARRLGTMDLAAMELAGEPVERVTRRFVRGTGRKGTGIVARGNRRWTIAAPQIATFAIDSDERYIDLGRALAPTAGGADPGGGADPADTAGPLSPVLVTASATAHSDRARDAMLWASADGGLEVRLNGACLISRPSGDGHRLGEIRIPVRLAEGANRLEVFVERTGGAFGFTALLCDEHGESLRGVECGPG